MNNLALLLAILVILFPNYNQANEDEKATPHEVAATEASSLDSDALEEWIRGPARYIANYDEEAAYKDLKTDEERLDFIYQFWKRRDPTPWTLKNEFRLQFWERVKTSNALFAETTKPGWKTDRGKIYILLGPADNIEYIAKVDYQYRHDPNEPLGEPVTPTGRMAQQMDDGQAENPFRDVNDSGHRGLERWAYRARKEIGLTSELIVPFYKDASGEYILSENPEHYLDIAYLKIPEYAVPIEKMVKGYPPRAVQSIKEAIKLDKEIRKSIDVSKLTEAKYDLGQAVDIASGEKILEESVKVLDYYEPLKSEPEFNFFPSEEDIDYALLSVDIDLRDFYDGTISEDKIIPIAIFGKAISLEDKSEYLFSSDDFAPRHIIREGDKASVMASFSAPLGKYKIIGGIQELMSGSILSFQKDIVVPDLENCELGISNYVLAKNISQQNDKQNPLRFGMNVLPKVDNEFHKNEHFGIYYQICGLGLDDIILERNFDVSYQFYVKDKGNLLQLGQPVVFSGRFEAEQGWSFPLNVWPSGEYVLEIEIFDKVKNQKSVSSVDFKVLD